MLDRQPLSIVASSPDSDASTRQTVGLMTQYIQAAVNHPPVLAATRQALRSLPMNAPAWSKAQAIWQWVVNHIRFKTDEQALVEMGYRQDLELLIAPYVLLETRAGDCDDFTMLTDAMLKCAGVEAAVVTIAADPDEPGRWSHVYAVAYLEDGTRLPLDTAAAAQGHGLFPGWEAPGAFRRQEWVA